MYCSVEQINSYISVVGNQDSDNGKCSYLDGIEVKGIEKKSRNTEIHNLISNINETQKENKTKSRENKWGSISQKWAKVIMSGCSHDPLSEKNIQRD